MATVVDAIKFSEFVRNHAHIRGDVIATLHGPKDGLFSYLFFDQTIEEVTRHLLGITPEIVEIAALLDGEPVVYHWNAEGLDGTDASIYPYVVHTPGGKYWFAVAEAAIAAWLFDRLAAAGHHVVWRHERMRKTLAES